MAVEVSFCVVNTEQRELLVRCLDAIAAEREALPFATEVLVLDNASNDGSAGAARRHPVAPRSSRCASGAARARTTPRCCSAPAGATRCCSTRTPSCAPGAAALCTRRSTERPRAAAAGARLLRPDGTRQPSAWRFPTPGTALVGARLPAPPPDRAEPRRPRRARSTGRSRPRSSCASRRPRAIGYFDPAFFVYSDEVDFCKRLRDAGWRTLYVPARRGRPPRAALDRRGARAADRRAVAQPRPLHAQAPLAGRGGSCACSRPGPTRCARSPRSSLPGPRPAALLAPRHRDAAPRPRRGPARGGRRAQPRAPAVATGARGAACVGDREELYVGGLGRFTRPKPNCVSRPAGPLSSTDASSFARGLARR